MDDKKIIDLYFKRDETAIPETSSKYGRLINSIAYNILKNITDSEECENDTYYAAWNQIPPQKPRCLPAFLGRITRNIALNKFDYYSAAMRNREFEVELSELESILSGGETPEEKYEAREVAEFISHFLRTKSLTKRVIFVKRYWYSDSISNIAKDYGFSESKVKSVLMRLRNELKIYLERQGIRL